MFLVISITSSNTSAAAYPWSYRICLNILLRLFLFSTAKQTHQEDGCVRELAQ